MQEMQAPSLGGEDPPEEEIATTPVFLLGKFHGQRSLAGVAKELDKTTTKKKERTKTK